MIKHYCDVCERLITKKNKFEAISFKVGKHKVCISIRSGLTNKDALCLSCVVESVNRLKTAPQGE